MDNKEMRQALRDAGKHVPRSNEDLEKAYNEAFSRGEVMDKPIAQVEPPLLPEEEPKTNIVKLASDNVWTYIGAGDTPPHMINFMGMEKFIRGQAKEVTNPKVIEKMLVSPCFVKGKVDQDLLFARDEEARQKAEKQREEDLKLQIEIERKYA
jgi:hypothetical protein